MTRRKSTPPEAALVAIDVAKHRNEVLIDPGHGRRRRMTVLNTRADHDRFIATLHALARPVIVGIEPTGNYHRVLAHRLIVAGFEVQLISTMALARTREALHNGWDKNDPKDAQVILHMLRIGATMAYQDPLAAGINDLQELSKTHEVVSKAKTEIWHRLLTHYLPLYFPEIERFAGNSRSDWFLAFLERFPTPASITVLAKDAFVAAAWNVAGRKVSKARLLGDIYATACTSAALPVPLDAPAIAMFRLVLAEARSLVRQRNVIEAQAHELLRTHPDYLRLCQAGDWADPCADDTGGGGRLAPVSPSPPVLEVLRFRSCHPSVRTIPRSDQALEVRQCPPAPDLLAGGPGRNPAALRDHFGRHIAKDRDNKDLRRKALTAVAAKMARVAHALVKTGTDYRPFSEVRYQVEEYPRSVGAVRARPEASTL
jgi:transposase